jgi:hypothetical protein
MRVFSPRVTHVTLRAALVMLGVAARAPLALAEDPLEAKAAAFRDALVERHLAAEGFVLYEIDLRRPADSAHQEALADTPTFTGLWAAVSCDRADVESGEARAQALADAERALAGLDFLSAVTGRPGLYARGAQRGPIPEGLEERRRWFPGAAGYEDYRWVGDVSHDQYANGVLPALAACRVHFPERTRALARALAELLLETGMQLVDPDGRRTRYGDLSRRAGWGFNSIAKLTGYGAFALGAELDGDPRWAEQRDRLRERDRVVETSLRTNVRIFGITNFSNDLMAWNLYRALVPLARRTGDPAQAALERGMQRAWKRVARDRNAYFTAIWCELEPGQCTPELLAGVRDTLERFPLEKRRLEPSPELARLPRAWIPGRKWRRHARDLVPIELRPASSLEWKSSPYRVWAGAFPEREYTGIDYLLAYWMYRRSVSTRSETEDSDRVVDHELPALPVGETFQ